MLSFQLADVEKWEARVKELETLLGTSHHEPREGDDVVDDDPQLFEDASEVGEASEYGGSEVAVTESMLQE